MYYAWIFLFKYILFKLFLYICVNLKYIKMENQSQEKVFTPEELEVKRKEMLNFYNESKPYLTAQLEHEQLLFQIDEVRFKRTTVQMQYAMLMNQMENPGQAEDEDTDFPQPEQAPTARKLKK
jgi:hypothetical protein